MGVFNPHVFNPRVFHCPSMVKFARRLVPRKLVVTRKYAVSITDVNFPLKTLLMQVADFVIPTKMEGYVGTSFGSAIKKVETKNGNIISSIINPFTLASKVYSVILKQSLTSGRLSSVVLKPSTINSSAISTVRKQQMFDVSVGSPTKIKHNVNICLKTDDAESLYRYLYYLLAMEDE